MGYINFLGCGSQGSQTEYRRDFYPKDTATSIGSTHTFKGKAITATSTDKTKEVIIDQAVKVTTVADKVRQNAQKLWSSLKNGCMGTFTATLILGISAGIAAVVTGVLLPPLWPVALAVGMVALGLLGFSIWNVCRSVEAKGQLEQWKDPIPAFQQKRRDAELKGFYHAYSSDYKGKIVSSEEIEKLWFKEMDKWSGRFGSHISSDFVKVQDIRDFVERCPLKANAMDYAFEATSPVDPEELAYLKTLSEKFTSLKGQYDTIRTKTEKLKSEIRSERSCALLKNDNWLKMQLAPYEALIYAQKLALIQQRTQYNQIITTYHTSRDRLRHDSRHNFAPFNSDRRRQTPLSNGRVVPNSGHFSGHSTATVGGHVIPGSGHFPGHSTATVAGHVIPGSGSFAASQNYHSHHHHHPVAIPVHVINAQSCLSDINQKLAQIELVYMAMTAPIRAVHSSNASKIKTWADGELKKIQTSEDKALIKFHQPIKAILDAYKNRNLETEDALDVDTKVEVLVDPKAPKLRDDFTPPKYDSSWSEYFCEVDWDNKILKKTTIEHKGNDTSTNSESISYSNK